jgi:hypothetical protein
MANRALAAERLAMMRLYTLLAALLIAASSRPAHSQTVWEIEPYRIQVLLAMEPGPRLTRRLEQELLRGLVERTDLLVGAAWVLESAAAEPPLRQAMLRHLDTLSPESLPVPQAKLDKLMLLAISADDAGYRISVREFDLRTQLLGTQVTMTIPQQTALPDAAFEALCSAFAPLAAVTETDPERKIVSLRLRAGALPPRDESLKFSQPGSIFQYVVRYNDREGNLQRVMVMPWTFLVVEEVAGPVVTTRVHSGLRSAVSGRQRGRVEQLALGVTPPNAESQLRLQSRVEPHRPLEGYEVYSYAPNSRDTRLLGRTDRDGLLSIPPGEHPLRLLLVKSGGALLAKLPFVPGLEPVTVAELPDDSRRLEVEGFVTGLQEMLVDLVAQREVLMHRVRARIKSGKLDEAQSLLDQLRRLKTRDEFAFDVQRQRQTLVSPDRAVQAKIDKLFNDTESLLGRFLNPADVDRLEAELKRARQASTTAQAAPRNKTAVPGL